jgi:hypothetical protein
MRILVRMMFFLIFVFGVSGGELPVEATIQTSSLNTFPAEVAPSGQLTCVDFYGRGDNWIAYGRACIDENGNGTMVITTLFYDSNGNLIDVKSEFCIIRNFIPIKCF